MSTKNQTEKIIINTPEEFKAYQGQNLKEKHLILHTDTKNIMFGDLENCIVEGGNVLCRNMTNCQMVDNKYVYAENIHMSTFSRCEKVECADEAKITESLIFHCKMILLNEADVSDCVFSDFECIHTISTIMKKCIVSGAKCSEDSLITMEDGEMSEVFFENIELKNDSYLIEGFGSPWVENCTFKSITTSREDMEIFHSEETRGLIFKRKKEFEFVHDGSCTGLDSIIRKKED